MSPFLAVWARTKAVIFPSFGDDLFPWLALASTPRMRLAPPRPPARRGLLCVACAVLWAQDGHCMAATSATDKIKKDKKTKKTKKTRLRAVVSRAATGSWIDEPMAH